MWHWFGKYYQPHLHNFSLLYMDIICFSHLRWDFVFQRPQHLLSRFASQGQIYFIEEPVFDSPADVLLEESRLGGRIIILRCRIAVPANETDHLTIQQNLLREYFHHERLDSYLLWFYTPMAMPLASALPDPALIVYDCMDELSAFRFAPADIRQRENTLIASADLMFTGGKMLYESKKHLHNNIHLFPSSIDKAHFGLARTADAPGYYDMISHPRIGFFGVVDERFDIELLRGLAISKPEWNFIIIGPVVKIDENLLPRAANIHYLGAQTYDKLPLHLAGWDVALIPFALNESTRFISPTKTPEYLSGGVPVVSTSIADVVDPYGNKGFTYIADDLAGFIRGIEWGLKIRDDPSWLKKVDDFLGNMSWDNTFEQMNKLIAAAGDINGAKTLKTKIEDNV